MQHMYPCVDSPNWGKYHMAKVDMVLIKMKPLIPRFKDLCRLPNLFDGTEGDDDFTIDKKGVCDEKVGVS